MADMQYKKGELLLEETVITDAREGYAIGFFKNVVTLNQEVLIIDINGIEYECKATYDDIGLGCYGANFTQDGIDFSVYSFNIVNGTAGPNDPTVTSVELFTENSGTYTVKVYTAIEDTDSSTPIPTDFIIDYLMNTPTNSNWNVLSSLLGDGDWSRLKAYVETTPKNMNRQVLKVLLEENEN